MQGTQQRPSLSCLLVKRPPAPPLLLPASHTQQRAGDGQSSTLPRAGVEAATKQPTQQRVGGIPTSTEEQRWQALMAQMNALQSLMLQQQSEIKELRSHQQNITNSNVMASATTIVTPVLMRRDARAHDFNTDVFGTLISTPCKIITEFISFM